MDLTSMCVTMIQLFENIGAMAAVIIIALLLFPAIVYSKKEDINLSGVAFFSLIAAISFIPTYETHTLPLNLSIIPILLVALHIGFFEALIVALVSTLLSLTLGNGILTVWTIGASSFGIIGAFALERFVNSPAYLKTGILTFINCLYTITCYYLITTMWADNSDIAIFRHLSTLGQWLTLLVLPNTAGTLLLNWLTQHLQNYHQLNTQVAQDELKFRNLVENSRIGIYIIQKNRLVYANRGVMGITRFSYSELLEIENIFDYIQPIDQTLPGENTTTNMTGKINSKHCEVRLVNSDFYRDVEINGRYVTFEGKPAFIGTMIDITDRKQFEVELHEKQERIQGILATMPDIVAVINKKGVVCEVLSHHQFAAPLTAKPAPGKSVYDILTPSLAEKIVKNMETVCRTRQTVSFEYTTDNWAGEIHLAAINEDEIVFILKDVTKYKQAEENYRRSTEKYQTLFNSSNDGIFVASLLDPPTTSSRFLEVNDAACKKLGYSREELLSLTVYDISEFTSRDAADQALAALMASGHSLLEVYHIAKDGTRIPVEVNSHLFNLWDSPRIISIARDISERKQAEQALRESEANFKYLADHLPVMVWSTNQYNNCIFVNKQWQKYTGSSLSIGTKIDWKTYIHPKDNEFIQTILPGSPDNQPNSFCSEHRMRRADGEYRWMQTIGIPRFNSDHTFVGYIGCCLDIHDKKHAENVLTHSYRRLEKNVESQARQLANTNAALAQEIFVRRAMEKRYRKLFDSVQDAIFVWKITPQSLPGTIIEVNDIACRWLDYSRDELLSRTMMSIMSSQSQTLAAPRMEKLLTLRQAIFDYDYLAKDGRLVPTEVNSHLFALNGELVGLCIARDISDRKQTEMELLAARNRISKAEKLASLGNMAAGIAHEINQPLNSIKVTADSILMWSKEDKSYHVEEFLEDVQTISTQATRIANIIKYIRDLIRSHQQKSNQHFNMTQVIQNAVAMMTPQLNTAGVVLSLDLTEEPLKLLGSLAYMEHVILNLTNNALEALESSPQVYKEIEIQTRLEDKIIIQISDNGPGISDAIKQKLFTPFFTTKGNGMGLGLAIVKSVVTSHGGQITAITNDNGGATFRLVFPLIDTEDISIDSTKEDNAS